MQERDHLTTLARGLRVLSILNSEDALTITKIARSLDITRSSANRIIGTLETEGYIERIPFSFRYRLTPLVYRISGGFSDESWITHIASPVLFEKTREIGWPLALATPVGESMMVRVTTDYAAPYALEHFRVGHRVPMMLGPTGHVFLAFSSEDQRKRLLDVIAASPDPKQSLGRDPDYVHYLLDKVRAQGFAHFVSSEYNEAGIAVPLFVDGTIRAALFIGYIKRALNPGAAAERFVVDLQEISSQISRDVEKARGQAQLR